MKKRYSDVPVMDADGRQVVTAGGGAPGFDGIGVLAEFELGEDAAARIGRAGGGAAALEVDAVLRLDREGSQVRQTRRYEVWVRGGQFQLVRDAGDPPRRTTLGPFPVGELLAAFRPTNGARAGAAMVGVLAYARAKDGSPPACPDDEQAAFRDLLSDMRHLADSRGWDFDEELAASGGAYGGEAAAEPEGAPPAPPAPAEEMAGG